MRAMDNSSEATRVEAGAGMLDDMSPCWFTKVSLEKLNMASFCNCVAGQLYGTYDKGFIALGLDLYLELEYGFDSSTDPYSLTPYWRREIEARLVAVANQEALESERV